MKSAEYDPVKCLREEVDRFQSTNTFTPMLVTNFYAQAACVLTEHADLQSQAEQLKAELERVRMVEFSCFECSDGSTPLYCLNCADKVLRTALEKCVVELEKARKYVRARQVLDGAIATAKPLLK